MRALWAQLVQGLTTIHTRARASAECPSPGSGGGAGGGQDGGVVVVAREALQLLGELAPWLITSPDLVEVRPRFVSTLFTSASHAASVGGGV